MSGRIDWQRLKRNANDHTGKDIVTQAFSYSASRSINCYSLSGGHLGSFIKTLNVHFL